MGAMASQITSLAIVYLTVYSGADKGKYQSSASLAFVREIHRWPVNSPHKGPVTRKMFPFDDVIMLMKLVCGNNPDSKVHGANTGPTWVLSAPDGPHVGPMNLAIRENVRMNWMKRRMNWRTWVIQLACSSVGRHTCKWFYFIVNVSKLTLL